MLNHHMKWSLSITFIFIIYLSLITGCILNDQKDPLGISTFSSDHELEKYLKEQLSDETRKTYDMIDAMPAPEGDTIGDNDFSSTNIQESGVDESDKVKSDGTYLYVAGENTVKIVEAAPPGNMEVIGKIKVRGSVDSLYLYKKLLVILYRPFIENPPWDEYPVDLPMERTFMMPWYPINSSNGMLLMDVSNPSNPSIIKDIITDGNLVSSRLTGDKLHIIQQYRPYIPYPRAYSSYPEPALKGGDQNDLDMDEIVLDDLLPTYKMLDKDGNIIESGRLVQTQDFFCPIIPEGGEIVTITTFDLDVLSPVFHSIGMIASVNTIYASTKALYLAKPEWHYPIRTSSYIDSDEQTIIHKFDLSGNRVEFVGKGEVPGRILNQFSLGEYEDVLRIATTTGELWGEDPTAKNHLFCLEIRNEKLEIIGKLMNLAPGEKIYAARFIGDRGFLVTFVNIDPLFTLDLSDPVNPRVVGELKVPGYSDYIHPLDKDHLLTIGKDAIAEGDNFAWYQGIQLSIFDLSDFGDPQLLHKKIIGDRGTSSEALHNHKAFTFWRKNDLLAIPVDLYEHPGEPVEPNQYGTRTFTGLYVYRVTIEDGFKFLGRISTADDDESYYGGWWTRGVFIEDSVYAVQQNKILSAQWDAIDSGINFLHLGD